MFKNYLHWVISSKAPKVLCYGECSSTITLSEYIQVNGSGADPLIRIKI